MDFFWPCASICKQLAWFLSKPQLKALSCDSWCQPFAVPLPGLPSGIAWLVRAVPNIFQHHIGRAQAPYRIPMAGFLTYMLRQPRPDLSWGCILGSAIVSPILQTGQIPFDKVRYASRGQVIEARRSIDFRCLAVRWSENHERRLRVRPASKRMIRGTCQTSLAGELSAVDLLESLCLSWIWVVGKPLLKDRRPPFASRAEGGPAATLRLDFAGTHQAWVCWH